MVAMIEFRETTFIKSNDLCCHIQRDALHGYGVYSLMMYSRHVDM